MPVTVSSVPGGGAVPSTRGKTDVTMGGEYEKVCAEGGEGWPATVMIIGQEPIPGPGEKVRERSDSREMVDRGAVYGPKEMESI